MARLFQRPGDKAWWLDFTDTSGRRRRVRTDTTSKRAAEDLLAEVRAAGRRQALGLEVAPTSMVKTVGEAWQLWLDRWCPPASKVREGRRFRANVRASWLASVQLTQLSGEHLDKWFKECTERGQSPRTINGHRRILRRVYNVLLQKRLYRGVNPVRETRPLEEPEYPYQVLSELELKRLLPQVPEFWRDLFHLAFMTGLRRGELYALRKDATVVDLERAILTPRASNDRAMTKGKRVKSIPLSPEAVELLRRAWDQAEAGALLFPGLDGELRSEHLRPAEVLRSAMARAGLVDGWLHVCRKPGCGVSQRHPDEQQRECPKCGRILWPKPQVRHVRFHDLRHSAANHLLDQGVPIEDVQLMMRHATLAITEGTYRHRTVEALRTAVSRDGRHLERHLEQLAAAQPPAVAEVLREAAQKLALGWHQPGKTPPKSPAVSLGKVR